jgi:hypothetical protein
MRWVLGREEADFPRLKKGENENCCEALFPRCIYRPIMFCYQHCPPEHVKADQSP